MDTGTRVRLLVAAATVGIVSLAGCGGSGSGGYSGDGVASSPTNPASPTAAATTSAAAVLKVAQDAKYGPIVVDGRGFAVYRFDRDTASPSASNCTGQCLVAWPAVVAAGAVTADGVPAGLLGTVTRADGTKQVTLAGWPLYLYQKDTKPGDTTGQGVNNVWWLVKPDGSKITTMP